MRGRREHPDPPLRPVQDRQQPPGIGGGVLQERDVGVMRQPVDGLHRQVRSLEIRIRVERHRRVRRVRDGGEIVHHARVRHREIGLQHRQDPVRPQRPPAPRLRHRVPRRRRRHPGDHRNAARRGLHRRRHHPLLRREVEIRELARRPQRRQPVNPRPDQVLAQPRQRRRVHLARLRQRRGQIGHHPPQLANIHHRLRSRASGAQISSPAKPRSSARSRPPESTAIPPPRFRRRLDTASGTA